MKGPPVTTLNEKIRGTIDGLREALPEELNQLIETGAGQISALDIAERALGVGDKAPAFDLPKYGGGSASLSDYLKDGPLVVTFYRGVWCPFCNLQLKEYDERLDEFRSLGANIVALTAEKPGALEILRETGASDDFLAQADVQVQYDILYDEGNTVARDFGIVFQLPKAHQDLLQQIGVNVEALTGSDLYAFADPATFVVKQDGTISYAFVPNNYRKRAEVDAITAAIRAIA